MWAADRHSALVRIVFAVAALRREGRRDEGTEGEEGHYTGGGRGLGSELRRDEGYKATGHARRCGMHVPGAQRVWQEGHDMARGRHGARAAWSDVLVRVGGAMSEVTLGAAHHVEEVITVYPLCMRIVPGV